MTEIRISNLVKRFGKDTAVAGVSLDVASGELLTFLGPSGCGKTTTLRCIAGFLSPDSGEIYFDGVLVNDQVPEKRNIGMVFQNWALWPHMTVEQNVEFGLKVRKVQREEARKRALAALELVKLSGFEGRYPKQLSGGQQQRVALARALVIEPKVLLLDEPLSNLDAKLRDQTRIEVRELQEKLGVTTIYVTHDQGEALAVSDRIAVLEAGKVVQIGTPEQIYDAPEVDFVASFIGETNIFSGKLLAIGQHPKVQLDSKLVVEVEATNGFKEGESVKVMIRPERIEMKATTAASDSLPNTYPGQIAGRTFLGSVTRYSVRVDSSVFLVNTPRRFAEKENVTVRLPSESIRVTKSGRS